MSAPAVDTVFEIARLLARSSASLVQGTPVQTVLGSVVPNLQRWFPEENLKNSLEPLRRLIQNSDPSRDEVAQGFYETGERLYRLTEQWEAQEAISGMHRRLRRIIQPSPTPPPVSGIFSSETSVEVTSDVVKQQMLEMLAFYVAGVMHDANNTLAPVHMSINETKGEWKQLHALAEQNKGLLPEEPGAQMMDYLVVIGKHVEGINRLVIRTAEMIHGVQDFLGLRDSAPIPPEAVAHLFEESGKMTQINFTLIEILQGLLEVDQNIERLNEMAKEHGHHVPRETLQQGVDFLASISADVRTFRGLVTRIVALFLSLRALKEGMKDLSPAPMNLHDHLDEGMLNDLAGIGIRIFFERDEDPWLILAVSPYVWQVVVNLLVNARQAMQDSGQIWISTRKTALDPMAAQSLSANLILPRAQAGEYMVLRIRDSGPGIPSSILPEIFKAGFSGKKSSGLGLSVLLSLVEGMRGFVVLETSTQSSENVLPGTAFSIYFPRASH